VNPDKPLIYVAGPISAPTVAEVELNVKKATDIGVQIFRMGALPVVPHLNHYLDLRAHELKTPVDYESYMALDFRILEIADALFFIAPSPGADRERAFALQRRIPVFEVIAQVPAWIAERKENP